MPAVSTSSSRRLAAAALLAGFAVGWTPVAVMLAARWSEPQYSHGWIVPLLAAGILWTRRDELPSTPGNPAGLLLILFGLGLETLGVSWAFDWLAAVSVIPAAAGCCVLLGGWPLARAASPAVLFLIFLSPLPWSVESSLSSGLQRGAASASAVCLHAIGIPAEAQGAILDLPSTRLGVAEACSGLRMLMVFAALTTAMAMVSRRRRAVKALLVQSALPIAFACNVARVSATAFVVENLGAGAALAAVHDAAGWLMVPLAMALIAAELRLLDRMAAAFAMPASLPAFGRGGVP